MIAVAGRLVVLLVELLQLVYVRKGVGCRAGLFLLVAGGLFLGSLGGCEAVLGVFEALGLYIFLEAKEVFFYGKLQFLAVFTLVLQVDRKLLEKILNGHIGSEPHRLRVEFEGNT